MLKRHYPLLPFPNFGSLKNIVSKGTAFFRVADSIINKHKADKQSRQNALSDSPTSHEAVRSSASQL